jgi:hypothetical protein
MTLEPNPDFVRARLALLAPPAALVPGIFPNAEVNSSRYEQLLRGMQRLRAKVYLEDGAIHSSEVSRDGCHRHPADANAWHLLLLGRDGEVRGCSRYVAHNDNVAFAQLGVRNAALSRCRDWGMALRCAIESEVRQARTGGISFVEVGGWALDPVLRCTKEALHIALGTYSLARILGGCIGITMATERHCSASILRRIGGRPLRSGTVEIPSYYDPQYDCEMQLLRFDSTELNPRFEPWVNQLCNSLKSSSVIRRENPAAVMPSLRLGLGRSVAHAVQ